MRKTNKKFLIPALSVGALVLAGAAVGAIDTTTASAASTDITVSAASVRYVDSNYVAGVRFQILLNKSAYTQDTEIGAKMIPAYYLGNGTIEAGAEQLASVTATELNESYSETQVEAIVYVYNIPEVNYGTDLKIAAYATTDGDTIYSQEVTCTLAEVAQASVATNSELEAGLKDYYTFDINIDGIKSEATYGSKLTKPALKPDATYTNISGTTTWDFDNYEVTGDVTLVDQVNSISAIDATIAALPEASSLTAENKEDYHEAIVNARVAVAMAIPEVQAEIANLDKLNACEKAMIALNNGVILDVSKSTATSLFVNPNAVGGPIPSTSYAWSGTIKAVTKDDKATLEVAVSNSPNKDLFVQIILPNLDGFDYVTFDIYGTYFRNDSAKTIMKFMNQAGETTGNYTPLPISNTWNTISVSTEVLKQYPYLCIGGADNEEYYVTNFVANGVQAEADAISAMIAALPEASSLTAENKDSYYEAIVNARVAVATALPEVQAKITNLDKLNECEAAIIAVDIAALPEASSLTAENKDSYYEAIVNARVAVATALPEVQAEIANLEKLNACESAMIALNNGVILDVSKSTATSLFVNPNDIGESVPNTTYKWHATFTSNFTYDSKTTLKFAVTNSGQKDLFAKIILPNLDGFDYVTFDIYGTYIKDEVQFMNQAGEIGATCEASGNRWNTIRVSTEVLKEYSYLWIDGPNNETYYITNFVAHTNAEA